MWMGRVGLTEHRWRGEGCGLCDVEARDDGVFEICADSVDFPILPSSSRRYLLL